MIKGLFVLSFSLLLISAVSAQSSRDVDRKNDQVIGAQPLPQYESVQRQNQNKGFFTRLFQKNNQTEVEQFRTDMKQVSKKRRKAERLADKPQYKDPTYFGHKKPPVKRPAGKQKFCKECGMKH